MSGSGFSSVSPDLGDRFELEQHLGTGGMGVVYRAWDRERQGRVALKALRRIDDPSAVLRLKSEFRALADLSHRNLVRLYELIASEEQWFFTMELIEGTSFLRWIRGQAPTPSPPSGDTIPDSTPSFTLATLDIGAVSPPEGVAHRSMRQLAPPADRERLADSMAQLVAGLEALHRAGLVHRDVKPSNVLVTGTGRVVLLDFGIIADVARGNDRPFELVGTPMYMAPEQSEPARDVTPAADWYAVGVMLYEALTGARPFSGAPADVLKRKEMLDPPRPSDRNAEVPPKLDALCQHLMRRDPDERAGPAEIRAAFGLAPESRRTRTPSSPPREILIGRERHREWLWDAYRASRHDGVLALIHGASGTGKSALARSFTDELVAREAALVLSGRCYERESVPYKAVDSLVDALSRELSERDPPEFRDLPPPHSGSLLRMFPVLRRVDWLVDATDAPGDSDLREIRRRAFNSLRSLFGALALERPLVVFVDDLQWGDADSAPLLRALLRAPAPPVLLLGSYRTEEQERSGLLRALREPRPGQPPLRELELGPLSQPDARKLAALLLRGDGTDYADQIAKEAGGHPYFVHQLARHWARRDDDDRPEAVELDDMIRRRVAELAADRQRLLELICAGGRPLAQSLVLEAAELQPSDRDLLQDLASAQLIRLAGARRSDLVEPWHDRVREAVIEGLAPASLRAHHRRLAHAFEAQRPDDIEALAVHHHAAGDSALAAGYAEQAGDQASRALAFDQAVLLYEMALDGTANRAAAHALEMKLGDALANAGSGAEAAARFVHAAESAEPAQAFELRRRAAFEYLKTGHLTEGLELLGKVLAQVGISMPRSPRAAFVSLVRQRAWLAIRGYGFKPRPASEVSMQELTRIDTCWAAAAGLAIVDSWRGADFGTRQTLRALRAGEPTRVVRAISADLFVVGLAGEKKRKQAMMLVAKARSLADELQEPALRGFAEFAAGSVHYQLGELRTALDAMQRALAIFRECAGVSWEIASANLFRMWTLLYLGELRTLHHDVQDLIEEARQHGDRYAAANLRTGLPALVHLVRDDPDTLFSDVADVLSEWSRDGYHLQHYWAMYAQANAHLYRGDPAETTALVERDWKPMRRSMFLGILTVRGEMLHLRGRAAIMAIATGDDSRAPRRRAARDASALLRQPALWLRPFGLLLRAGLAAADNPAEAASILEHAERSLNEFELAMHAQGARYQRGRLTGDDQLVSGATEWLLDQGVVRPDRFVEMIVPLAGKP